MSDDESVTESVFDSDDEGVVDEPNMRNITKRALFRKAYSREEKDLVRAKSLLNQYLIKDKEFGATSRLPKRRVGRFSRKWNEPLDEPTVFSNALKDVLKITLRKFAKDCKEAKAQYLNFIEAGFQPDEELIVLHRALEDACQVEESEQFSDMLDEFGTEGVEEMMSLIGQKRVEQRAKENAARKQQAKEEAEFERLAQETIAGKRRKYGQETVKQELREWLENNPTKKETAQRKRDCSSTMEWIDNLRSDESEIFDDDMELLVKQMMGICN